jgi:hypothetical protein
MTDFTQDGFKIDSQDLSSLSPTSDDNHRVYNHDGSSTLTLTDGSTTSKKGWYMWSNPDSAWFPMGQHADLVDGYHGKDLAALAENETVSGLWSFDVKPDTPDWKESDVGYDETPLSISTTKWADGLSNEEIHRVNIPVGKSLYAYSLDIQLKGGGSLTTPSNLEVDLYDATNATQFASDTADGTSTTGNPIGSSGDGAEVLVRITNSSGSYQKASIQGRLLVK